MPDTTEVQHHLEQLKAKLDKLAPAIELVGTAARVTKLVAGIADDRAEVLKKVQAADDAFREQSRKDFSKMVAEVKIAVADGNDSVLALPDSVKQKLDAAVKVHEEKLTQASKKYTENLNNLLAKLSETFQSIAQVQAALKQHAEVITEHNDRFRGFLRDLEAIAFTNRMDKLDASVAGVVLSTQNMQSAVGVLERSVAKMDGETKQADADQTTKLKKLGRQFQILMVLVVLAIIASVLSIVL